MCKRREPIKRNPQYQVFFKGNPWVVRNSEAYRGKAEPPRLRNIDPYRELPLSVVLIQACLQKASAPQARLDDVRVIVIRTREEPAKIIVARDYHHSLQQVIDRIEL